MAARLTKEFRDAAKFVTFISPIDFRLDSFAAYLTGESVAVKERIVDLLAAFVFAHSQAYNEGRHNPDEVSFYIKNERMRDALEAYYR